MNGAAEWMLAAGAIALMIGSYWLRFWFRREVIYRPLQERRGRTDARPQAGSTSDLGAPAALRELADHQVLDVHRQPISRPRGQLLSPPITTDPSTTERIATLASADRRSPHA